MEIERIKSAIVQIPQREWVEFFESLRQEQYNQLRAAETDAERLRIQTLVKGFDMVQNKFSEIREKSLDKLKKT